MQPDENTAEALLNERISSAVLVTVGALVVVLDRQGRIMQFNRVCQDLTGYTSAEVEGRIFWEFLVPSEDMAGLKEAWTSLTAGLFPNKHENQWLTKDGARRFVAWTNSALTGETGEIQYIIGTGIDITERKQAEEKLRESEYKYRSIFENSQDAIFLSIPDVRVMAANPAACEIFGMTEEELCRVGRNGIEDPTDPRHAAAVAERARTGRVKYEATHVRKDGSKFPSEVSSVILDGGSRSFVILRDITERKRAEEALHQNQAMLARAEKIANLGCWEWDIASGALFWSEQIYRIFGVEPERFVPSLDLYLSLIHPEDRAPVEHAIENALTDRKSFDLDYRILLPDSSTRWIHALGEIAKDESGNPVRMTGTTLDITERKRAEEVLAATNERLRTLLDTLPVAVTIAEDPECRVITTNPAGAQMFGVPPERNVSASAPEPERPAHRYFAQGRQLKPDELPMQLAVSQNRVIEDIEIESQLPDGKGWTALVSAAPLHDAVGKVIGGIAVAQNITERKLGEEALRQSHERLEWVLETTGVGSWMNEMPLGRLNWDIRTHELFFIPPDVEPTIELFWARIHPEDHELTRLAIETALRNHTCYAIDHRAINPVTGEIRWVHSAGQATYGDDGAPIRFDGINYDITDRMRAEEALRGALAEAEEGRRILHAMMEHIPMGITIADAPDVNIRMVSRYGRELTGRPREQIEGIAVEQHTEQWGIFRADGVTPTTNEELPLTRATQQGKLVKEEVFVIAQPDGTKVPILCTASPIRDAEGNITGGVIGWQDITERKQMEEALASAHALLDTLLQQAPIGFCYFDRDLHFVMINEQLAELNGVPAADHIGKHVHDIVPSVLPFVQEVVGRILETGQPVKDHEFSGETALAPGITRYWNESWYPVRDGVGEIVGFGAVVEEITERKRAEAALRGANAKLMESDRRKDEFLAMLAHELRNPLAPVRYAIQIMNAYCGSDCSKHGRVAHQREIIERQIGHMAHLIDDLLDVARITSGKIDLRKEMVDLVGGVRHSIDSCRQAMEHKHQELIASLPEEPLWLEGDLIRLEQVFTNLLSNACKYSPADRRIWVSVSLERSDGDQSMAVVRVRDEGDGMSAELLPHVFELFTQGERDLGRAQGGLGIGLTMVQKLVQMHGGTIQAHSDGPGKGSEFVVRLPLMIQMETGDAKPVETALFPTSRSLKILAVDDVVDTAESLAELLGLYGHQTRVAFSGSAALEIARTWRPEVILLDLGMPGMDGYEVARRLRAEYGKDGMTLIALTGYGQETDHAGAQAAGFDDHLVKPVDLNALCAALERIPA